MTEIVSIVPKIKRPAALDSGFRRSYEVEILYAIALTSPRRVFRFSSIAKISSFRRKPESSVSCCKDALGSRFRGNDGIKFLKTERPCLAPVALQFRWSNSLVIPAKAGIQ